MRQQRAEHVRVCEQIALAAREDRWHAQPGGQKPFESIPSSVADDHREGGRNAHGLRWISRHAPELLIVIDPARVVRIGRPAASHEKRANLGCGRRGNRIAGGIHAAVRIRAVREEQLHQLAFAGARRRLQRSALRRRGFTPVRIGATLEKQARDRVMASFDGRRERSSSARPRFPDSRRFRVEDLPDAFDVAESRGNRQIARRTVLEQQLDHAAVSGATPVPDGEIDRLKIGPEPSAEAARGAENGMHVGATIEQQRGELVRTAADRSMERRCADLVADVHEAWIGVEQPADFLRVARG